MRPPCPWREAEVAEFRPEVSGRREGEDVGFVSPGHCPGCEQEEAAAHPGRPHPVKIIQKSKEFYHCLNLLHWFHDFSKFVQTLLQHLHLAKPQPDRVKEHTRAIHQTPSAVNKIKQLLKDKPEHVGVKVGVRTRGCNGLSYTLEYTKTKGDSDEEVVQDGVRVFIEKKAQLTLLGTEMDYVEDKLSSEFVFNNPNIKGTCGCGESFNI
ncbi:hypothetical protein EI555_014761 [Monodon monoceros]|uniref:Iron-sulfur cluster assembly 1 homolog, mitochondrial n=1 Tax=Monodon monoceros TaxID=40151 RepID=A0A4U1F1Y7_MONMO|nr:hypothetical protein EI555_014761 [Monodon monoceros]